MSLLRSIVEDSEVPCKAEAPETDPEGAGPPRSAGIERSIHEHVRDILELLKAPEPSRSFDAV